MRKAILCDIDGCLLDISILQFEMDNLSGSDEERFDYFEKYANDPHVTKANANLVETLTALYNQGFNIIFSTARSENIRVATENRLNVELDFPYELLMRPRNNQLPAWKLKKLHYEVMKKQYDIKFAIDDEYDNLMMYNNNGLLALGVAGPKLL